MKYSTFSNKVLSWKKFPSYIVCWKGSKEETIVDFLTKAKNVTTLEAKKDVWIKKFIIELGVVPRIVNSIKTYYDND